MRNTRHRLPEPDQNQNRQPVRVIRDAKISASEYQTIIPDSLTAFFARHFGDEKAALIKDSTSDTGIRPWNRKDTQNIIGWIAKDNISRSEIQIVNRRVAYDIKETARIVGVNVQTVRAWLYWSANPLPHFRENRRVIIPRHTLLDWLSDETMRYTEQSDNLRDGASEVTRIDQNLELIRYPDEANRPPERTTLQPGETYIPEIRRLNWHSQEEAYFDMQRLFDLYHPAGVPPLRQPQLQRPALLEYPVNTGYNQDIRIRKSDHVPETIPGFPGLH